MGDFMKEICITIILKWKKGRHREVFNLRSQSRLGLKTNLEPKLGLSMAY